MNSISSSHNLYSCICSFFLLPVCTIRYTGVRPGVSSVNFAISISVCCISSHTSSTTSILSMPIHDSVVVSSKCVVSTIQYAIYSATSLAASFNCVVGSHFSSSSILALCSVSTVSILSAIAFVRMITFCTFSITEVLGSSRISGSSEHNSATDFLMLASSFFHYAADATALRYLLSMLSCSCLSATFFALTIYSLSLNSSVICTCRVLSVSEGSATKSSCAASSCSPSYAVGQYMLIGVTTTNLC